MNETPPAVQQTVQWDFSQFALALESLGDAVTIVGSNDRIKYANGACQRVYGYSKTELVGEPALILVPPGEESVADEVIRASPGEKWEDEVVRVRKGGREIPGPFDRDPHQKRRPPGGRGPGGGAPRFD